MTTKTISASKLRTSLADALNALSKDDILIITRRGKNEKAVVDIDRLEDLLATSDPEYLKSIREAREQYKKGEVFSFEEVFGGI